MLINGRKTPAGKISARDEAMRRAEIGRSAKRTQKSLENVPPSDAAPRGEFDRAGWAQFLWQWSAELDMLGEIERERLEARAVGYFYEGSSPAGWIDIVKHLHVLRRASRSPEPVIALSRVQYDAPPYGGW